MGEKAFGFKAPKAQKGIDIDGAYDEDKGRMSRISEKLTESQMILRQNAASSAKKSMATNKQVESSHPDCPFCNVQFIGLEFDEE